MEENKNKVNLKLVIGIILIVVLLILGGTISQGVENLLKKETITTAYISGKLEGLSELTTQKLTYSGVYSITEGEIPLITEKGFTMTYNAEVKASINFDEVDIDISKKKLKIKIPHSTIQAPEIKEETIKFITEKKALFNWTEKTDITQAIANAEKSDLENMDYSQLLLNADNYAETILHKIFDGAAGNREVEISFK